jgi:hypothetical protein
MIEALLYVIFAPGLAPQTVIFQAEIAGGTVFNSAGSSPGVEQTPLSTPQANWSDGGMGTDPWDDGASLPTPAGEAYMPYTPNKSER